MTADADNKALSFSAGGTVDEPARRTHLISGESQTASILANFLRARLKYVLLLVLGLSGFGICAYILTTVQPDQIANIFFYHSYLPLVLSCFLATFFVCTFLFLHSRRALAVASMVGLLLFLRLQDVVITTQLLAVMICGMCVIELLMTFIFKK